MCVCVGMCSCSSFSLSLTLCVCYWQHVLRARGAQTASTHVTVTTEPSAAPQTESVTAALDGRDSTVLSVSLSHTHRSNKGNSDTLSGCCGSTLHITHFMKRPPVFNISYLHLHLVADKINYMPEDIHSFMLSIPLYTLLSFMAKKLSLLPQVEYC